MTKKEFVERLKNKKTLAVKKEPKTEDLLELIEKLNPDDLKKLYFFIIGILSTRGYEVVD